MNKLHQDIVDIIDEYKIDKLVLELIPHHTHRGIYTINIKYGPVISTFTFDRCFMEYAPKLKKDVYVFDSGHTILKINISNEKIELYGGYMYPVSTIYINNNNKEIIEKFINDVDSLINKLKTMEQLQNQW